MNMNKLICKLSLLAFALTATACAAPSLPTSAPRPLAIPAPPSVPAPKPSGYYSAKLSSWQARAQELLTSAAPASEPSSTPGPAKE